MLCTRWHHHADQQNCAFVAQWMKLNDAAKGQDYVSRDACSTSIECCSNRVKIYVFITTVITTISVIFIVIIIQ